MDPSSQLPSVASVLAGVPPPLPPRESPQDSKIAQLRETSEAVERLVRAFAMLRGHAGASSADTAREAKTSFPTKDTEKLSSLRQQHGIGDAATVRTCPANIRHNFWRRPPPRDDSEGAHQEASLNLNEAAVEDAIMCLVMELLQRDAKQPFEENVERKAIQPSFEMVDMDNFKFSFSSKSSKSHRATSKKIAPLSVFDGGFQAFAPGDADASESLYHSILQALQKYVASHVVTSVRHVGNMLPPASAQFAWVLQLDLLSVCMQILESRFSEKHAGTKGNAPVWIQYEGPREGEVLARNAVHCLPFEALDAKRREKHTFRLEYWVTKDKMWTVVEALAASIREGIVARSDGYRIFSADDDLQKDPDMLFPTRVPFFSLVTLERLGKMDDEEIPRVRKAILRRNEEEPDSNFFHIETATLELVAHAVSTTSTEILEADNQVTGKNFGHKYQDATAAVAEALCELLDDAGIRVALKRRARAKMMEVAKRREVEGSESRQEKERHIIETAEAQAERVVQRILQEIQLEEKRGA